MDNGPLDSNDSSKVIQDDELFRDQKELSTVEIAIGIVDVLTEETWCVWVSFPRFSQSWRQVALGN